MEISKRWECAKKFKLCFRCLGEGHLGQSCFRTRVCGLDGCQEVYHRLLRKHAVGKNTGVLISGYQQPKGVNVDKNGAQQQKVLMLIKASFQVKETFLPLRGRMQIEMLTLQWWLKHLKEWEMWHSEQFLYILEMVTVS